MRTLLILTLLAPAHGSSGPPADPPGEQTEAAKHLFEQGAQLYADGDLPGARFAFERAFERSGNYKILYNLAVVELELHDYAAAKGTFERYLREGGEELDAKRRAEVDAELEGLAARVGEVRLTIQPANATMTLDGEPYAPSGEDDRLQLNLGEHTVEVRAPGHEPKEARFEVEGGALTELSIVLEQRVPPPSTVPAPRADPAPALGARTRRLRIGTWVSLGTAGVAGAAAVVAGILSLRAEDDIGTEFEDVPADRDAVDAARRRTRSLAITTDVLIGVGAVAGATAIGLGIAAWRASKRDRSGVRASASGLEVRF
ncbi:MAG: PEGA domain-containing protein [Nannocystaceae bacterium]|nr:PEGA domain-containing protein [bacterium]